MNRSFSAWGLTMSAVESGFVDGSLGLEGDGDEDQYVEYVMYTHNSHLKWSDAGHVRDDYIFVKYTDN